jgi:Ca2+-transporting ATPase
VEQDQKRLNTLVFNTFVWLQIFNEFNNRRLDNKLNIFEGITHNWFFISINIVMVGGQVLIIFVGGQAFKIVPLNAKEWGLSIGLGAISIPWGAAIRKCPDAWAQRIGVTAAWPFDKIISFLPSFKRRKDKKANEKTLDQAKGTIKESEEFRPPPLRTITSLRGPRVREHIGLRDRVHNAKDRAKCKMKG